MYALGLSSLLHPGMRVWDPSYALSKDPEVWEKAQQDTVISGSIERSLLDVAGQSWDVVAHSEDPLDMQLAEIVGDVFRKMDAAQFSNARRNLAEARLLGSAFARITGDFHQARIHDGKRRRWWIPGRLVDVDRRRMRAIAQFPDGGGVVVRWEIHSPTRKRWEVWNPRDMPMVRVVYCDRESALGYGRGIMDSVYYGLYIRTTALKYGLQGLQRWAQGLLLGKIDLKAAGGTEATTEQVRDKMLADLRAMLGDNVLVVSKDDEVEVVTGGMEGHQIVDSILNRVERELVTRIEGTPLSVMSGESGGAYALGKEHGTEQHTQRRFDREMLAGGLGQLIEFTVEMNKATLVEVNPLLLEANLPKFDIQDQRVEDPKRDAEVAEIALRSGARISRREYHDRIGWGMPADDEEVLEPPERPAQPFGGMDLNAALSAAARAGAEEAIRAMGVAPRRRSRRRART